MKNVILVFLFLFCCLFANGQDYLKLANECFEKGDYECAKRNYTFFQTFDGRDMNAQILKADECIRTLILADEYFKNSEWEKARDRYTIVLEKNPKDPFAKKQLDLCEEHLKTEYDRLLAQEEAQKREQIAMDEVKPFENLNLTVQPDKKSENLKIKTGNNRSGLLFAAGGVSIAGGIAATLLMPKTDIKISDGKLIKEKKYALIYAGAGIVVGGISIGSGIKIKKKDTIKLQNSDLSYNRSLSPSNKNYSHINLVVYGNEAGLRLTF